MNEKLKRLSMIVAEYDELVGMWFDGCDPEFVSTDEESVYEKADALRNEAMEILKDLSEEIRENGYE